MKADEVRCFSFLYIWAFWCSSSSSFLPAVWPRSIFRDRDNIRPTDVKRLFLPHYNRTWSWKEYHTKGQTEGRKRLEQHFRKPLWRNGTLLGTLSHQLGIQSGQWDRGPRGSGPAQELYDLAGVYKHVCVFLCTCVTDRERKKEQSGFELSTFVSVTPGKLILASVSL